MIASFFIFSQTSITTLNMPEMIFDTFYLAKERVIQNENVNNGQIYDSFASSYSSDNSGVASSLLQVDELRKEAASYVYGNVLEIAVGSGLQAKYYDPSSIKSFTGIDSSQGMLNEAKKDIYLQNLPLLQLKVMDATNLKFDLNDKNEGIFDTIIDTYSLCVINDPQKAVNEMARLVKPSSQGGKIVLLENSRSNNGIIGAFQDVTEPYITATSTGKCRWNVNIDKFAETAGLEKEYTNTKDLGTLSLNIYHKK